MRHVNENDASEGTLITDAAVSGELVQTYDLQGRESLSHRFLSRVR